MGIVTHFTTTVASIGVVCHCCLHWSIVGHTWTWCLGVSLLLRALITKLLLVLGTLLVLVLVARRVLALIPLTRGPLVPGRKALLRKHARTSVAARCLPLNLPLLSIHLFALIVNHNSAVHKFLEAGVNIGHQLQLQAIIQSFQETTLLVRILGYFTRSVT
jgi:hypothetical protein